jgi:LmbE family N-acetylglucosaminyl deacetylase
MHDHSNRRPLYRSVVALAILSVTLCGRFLYGLHADNMAMQGIVLPVHTPPAAGARVLVVAPHCDDETLGAGGLIAGAVRRGAQVSVVFVTNGDGFPMAVSRKYHRLHPGPKEFRAMARARQAEAREALAHLGVPRERIYFLGYPDRGVAELWNQYWSRELPYTSRFTGCSVSPYRDSFHRGAVYCGRDLMLDLESLLRRLRPQSLYIPHPGDDHPDHWATYCFTTAALEELRDGAPGAGTWAEPEVFTFLVHRGDWPVPQGLWRGARLVPPAALAHLDTEWSTLTLSGDEEADKEAALLCYRSQTAVMKRFLTSFVRRDELFGTLAPEALFPGGRGPGQYQTAINDSTCDTLIRRLEGSGDLTEVEAGLAGDRLRLRVSARLPLSPRVTYYIRLHPLGSETGSAAPFTIPFDHLRCLEPSVDGACAGTGIELSIPLARLGHPAAVLVGADSRLGRVMIDRVGWRLLRLPAQDRPLLSRRHQLDFLPERPEDSARRLHARE